MQFPDTIEQLKELLSRCTVRVVLDTGHGTGFVVAPGLVLTAHHVIQDAIASNGSIRVTTYDNRTFAATPRDDDRRQDASDVALLDVDTNDLPCVVFEIEPVPGGVDLVTGGYPSGSVVPYQTHSLTSGGEQNYDLDADGGRRPNLRLRADVVIGGMSGSPVLNLKTGFVCGVVRLTLDERYPVGGFAIPMSTVLRELPVLKSAYVRPQPGAAEWIKYLGDVQLKQFKRDPDGTRWDVEERVSSRVDLNLQRDEAPDKPLSEWRVAIPSAQVQSDWVRGSDLGAFVMEAVNRWSQRQTFGSKVEAKLLGNMLYHALLPPAIEALVEDQTKSASPVLLRVQVDPTNRLAQIPWEYALNGEEDETVATSPTMAFSRYVDTESVTVPLADKIRVLVLVACPPDFRERSRAHPTGAAVDATPLADQLLGTVAETIQRTDRLDGAYLANVDLDGFTKAIAEDGPWDVIHYIGVGWEGTTPQDDAVLAFSSGTRGDAVPLRSVVDTVTSHEACRLVVLQLLSVPGDSLQPPIGVVSLLPFLSKGVQALVVGQHAATTQHLIGFNKRFYPALAAGDAVEFAVQKARLWMRKDPPDMDFTAFGTVTVTTTRSGELRLLSRAAGLGKDAFRDPTGVRPTSSDSGPQTGLLRTSR